MLTFFGRVLAGRAIAIFRLTAGRRADKELSPASTLEFNGTSQGKGRDMPLGTKATRTALLIAVTALPLATPAYSQGLAKKGASHAPPPPPSEPVDEKAYKSALDRIPTPKQGYDPWGQMRPAESAKTPGKSK
jgi:hypothetical protein